MARKTSKLATIPQIQFNSRAAWRPCLAAHNNTAGSIWFVNFKKSSGRGHVPYDDIVEEGRCFGWIDGLVRKLDAERSMLLLSRRKPRSTWSKLNKLRVPRLIRAGLMSEAGLAKIKAAKADGSWSALDDAEALRIPPDLAQALRKDAAAKKHFAAFSKSSTRAILWWITSAKRPETRNRRIAETIALASRNLRANFPESRQRD